MKRLRSSDSLVGLMSMCRPSTEEHDPRNNSTIYSREFQSMLEGLDDEGCVEETGHVGSEKKRRLSVEQVKALEKNFEVENKLEPERKVKLAQELGLQPRQVAVWFQNRRARWKTKQLERDYGVLKSDYDSLKLSYDSLCRNNEDLLKEIKELKSKLNDETNSDDQSNVSLKDHSTTASEPDNVATFEDIKPAMNTALPSPVPELSKEANHSSDSNSSAILNDENAITSANNNAVMSSSSAGHHHNLLVYQPQFVKMEEHNFFSADETCNFFSDEQPPTLQWYCPDQWN